MCFSLHIVYQTKDTVSFAWFTHFYVFRLAQLFQTLIKVFFSLAAGRLPVQSIIWLLLPSLTVSENTVKPQSSQIDFHSQLVFTFEIVQSAACLWGCQECTLFNLETPDKSQADWTATPSNSNRIKLRSIKWTAQDSVIQACLCYCKRKVTSVIQEKVKLPKWKKKAFL